MSIMRQQHWNDYIVKLLCNRRTDQVELNFGVSCYRLTANLIMPRPYNKPINIVCEAYIFDNRKQNAYHNMCFLIVSKVPKPLKNRIQYCDSVSTLAAQLSWFMLLSIVGILHQSGRCQKSKIFFKNAPNLLVQKFSNLEQAILGQECWKWVKALQLFALTEYMYFSL